MYMVDIIEKNISREHAKETNVEKEALPSVDKNTSQEKVVISDKNNNLDISLSTPANQSTQSSYRDEDLIVIENVLSEDILEVYNKLSEMKKREFKKRGEFIAVKIKTMLRQTKVRAEEIFNLIKNWLKMLPNINHYFLEQEAKIKTDKILNMRREGQIIEK